MVKASPKKTSLGRIGDVIERANSFRLFRTGNALEDIQGKIIHRQRENGTEEILNSIGEARETLKDEHSDVGTANRYIYRRRRGLIVSAALLGAMIANVVTTKTPDFIRNFPTDIKDNFQVIVAGLILAVEILGPVRDFIFSESYKGVKSRIEEFLVDLENELKRPGGFSGLS